MLYYDANITEKRCIFLFHFYFNWIYNEIFSLLFLYLVCYYYV